MSFVKLEVCDEIAVVTVDREKALNALNKEVLKDLDNVFKSIDIDQVRVVVLTGAGKRAFVAGADIAEMHKMSFMRMTATLIRTKLMPVVLVVVTRSL